MPRPTRPPRGHPTAAASPVRPFRAAIYVRVSTEDQALSGYGLDVQRARCLAMATVKGWPDPTEYSDEGLSGTKGPADRPSLARLLKDAAAGHIDAVIVLALDRLGRRTRLVLELADTLTAAGVALISCKETLDTTTPQGQFALTLFAGLAQLERDTIVERTTAGRDERGRQDGERGGRLPYGYQRQGDKIVIEKEAAKVVRRIFGLRAGGASLRAIAEQLGDVPGPRGGSWPASCVKAILDNEPAYRGGERGASRVRWPVVVRS